LPLNEKGAKMMEIQKGYVRKLLGF
jgi:hypothetical protein